MKKRISAILLALALCLSLLPAAALAADHNGHSQGWTALTAGTTELTGGNYYLGNDVTCTGNEHTPITVSGTVTLCLNGHVLDLGGQYITVDADTEFTLCDCTGGTTYGNIGSGGLWEKSDTSGNCNLTGGVLTGGKGYQIGPTVYGGGVFVSTRGDFNMTGGNIAGNSAQCGGGVYVAIDSTFTMSGGAITGNQASSSSSSGGGVYVAIDGTFTMSGGAITGNRANGNGGGVFVDGTLNLFGNPVIQDNTVAGSANNLYLMAWKTMVLLGPLGENTRIGMSVGRDHSRTLTSGWSTHMSSQEPADYFFSDDADYGVALANNEAVLKEWGYTVAFDPNGGTGTMASQGFFAGETKALTGNGFTRTGYTFNGWSTTAEGGPVEYTDGAQVSDLAGSGTVTLYAQWRANTYTVIFDPNGGTGSMDNQEFTYGTAQGLRQNTFTKEGCTFDGWSTTKTGDVVYTNGQSVSNLTSVDNGTVTLYAVWSTAQHTIRYEDVENTAGLPTTHTYGTDTVIPDPTRTGYTFGGWTINGGTDVYTSLTLGGEDYTGDITLTATWTANTYTVTFEANGSTGDPMGAQTFTYDVSQTLPTNTFTKKGYTFDGWSTQPDGNGTDYADQAEVSNLTAENGGTVTLYAQWTANTYTVTFEANGGDGGSMGAQTFTYDVSQALPTNTFTKKGYTFTVWNTNADGSGVSYDDTEMVENLTAEPNGTVTLYAQWNANTYTVTFEANGGEGTMADQPFTYDTAQNLDSNTFTRTGYTFTGWNTQPDGNGTPYEDGESVTLTGNLVLYAQWTANTYTVTFDPNGGSGTMTNQAFTYGEAKNLSANGFTKEGYTFDGWSTQQDGGGTTYVDEAQVSNLTAENNGTVTLYAQWTAHTYTVKFDPNGGEGNPYTQSFTYGETKALTANAFTKVGCTFAGWNTAADGSGTTYVDEAQVTNLTAENNGTVTLYAQWKINTYTVTFDSNGGSAVASQEVSYGSPAAKPDPAPIRDGYAFLGWYTDKNCTQAYNFSTPITGNLTLYAGWEIIVIPVPGHAITVTTDGNGTVTTTPSRAEAGETVAVNVLPDAGYEVASVTVTTVTGEEVALSGNQFTMPSASVTVKVTFRRINSPFSDVNAADWFYEEVLWAYENGVMDGVGGGKFAPGSSVSRAMVWTVLARMDGQRISGSDWAEQARAWAMAEGISDGTMANGNVTREQLSTMLWRFAQAQGWDVSIGEDTNIQSYPDFDQVSDYAIPALQWACGAGVINGMDGILNPKGSATRAQLAAMLMRFDSLDK